MSAARMLDEALAVKARRDKNPTQEGETYDPASLHGTATCDGMVSGRAPAQGAGPAGEAEPAHGCAGGSSSGAPFINGPLADLDRDAIVLLATDLPSTSRHPRDRAENAAHDKAIRAARVWCTGEGIDWAALANERWATAEDRPPT